MGKPPESPHMAFTPFAGTAGRIKAILVAPDLTTANITWTGTTATIAGIVSWDLTLAKDGGAIESLNFEGATDGQGNLYPTKKRGGVARWTASITGEFDGDPASTGANVTSTLLPVGGAIVIDFLVEKSASLGWEGCNAVITSFAPKTSVTDKLAMFTLQVEGSGALPAFSYS